MNYDGIADSYDRWVRVSSEETKSAVSALAVLANNGMALELGIGTGRVAIPLADRGISVHGIERSRGMVKQLRKKLGAKNIAVHIGDFEQMQVRQRYSLIYIVFNTFFELGTKRKQLRCMKRVASSLKGKGVFVIEALGPNLEDLKDAPKVSIRLATPDEVRVEITRHDFSAQILSSQHVVISAGGIRRFNVTLKYLSPDQLDSLAESAGMRLRCRWSDWLGNPITIQSKRHISLYEL